MDIKGPCLPWCLEYNQFIYLLLGLLLGLLLCIYLKNQRLKKKLYTLRN